MNERKSCVLQNGGPAPSAVCLHIVNVGPLVAVRVVALDGAQPVRPVEAAHHVDALVDHRDGRPGARRVHRRDRLPLVRQRVVPVINTSDCGGQLSAVSVVLVVILGR